MIALMAVAMLPAPSVHSEELRLIGATTSFYCYPAADEASGTSGMACDLMQEMARRVGHSGKIQLYPLPRAVAVGASSTGVLVAPVGRLAAREKLFGWQVQLFEDEVVVVTRADSKVDISSLVAVRKLSIGAVRNGVGALIAEELQLPHVDAVAHDDINARKLQAGRIDAWLSPWNGILAAQRQIGSSAAELRRGVILKRVQAYMASSPDVTPNQVADWKAAMHDMIKDGTYERILRKYQFVLPK
ncbi:transporter substrate-binding domain-containing protein [Duganella sp. FT135W]|uniref:Transporter substrate-binding domain-containing protein n=1 Tax=Duganella flavida TaxID=2692175 RepID=A0A6L8KGF4_9BURK|nr:transporter substrate-binding domain-containing protein [Duganella flavida]MYM26533.1 transporter substrate-binding domain-containing protein [Duganella flavida]